MKIKFICCILAAAFISILTGCSQSKNTRIANELHFSLNGVFDVTISYDEENITFLKQTATNSLSKNICRKIKADITPE